MIYHFSNLLAIENVILINCLKKIFLQKKKFIFVLENHWGDK